MSKRKGHSEDTQMSSKNLERRRCAVVARNIQDFYHWQDKHPELEGVYVQFPKDLAGLQRTEPIQVTSWFQRAWQESAIVERAISLGYKIEYEEAAIMQAKGG